MKWRVMDDRKAPSVLIPESISQGPIVNFSIRAEDPNGEMIPILKESTVVPFGVVKLTKLDSGKPNRATDDTYPFVLYSVTWDQIRAEDIGKTVPLSFKFCDSASSFTTNCTTQTMQVTITGNSHPAPVVQRSAWPVSQIGSVRVGQTLRVNVPIEDAENPRTAVTVEILPASMASSVNWFNGVLTVSPKVEGLGQFALVAKSAFDQKTIEGFFFEALPASWEPIAIISGYGPSAEALDLKALIGRGEVLSGVYQMNPSQLRLRDAIIVTSDALNTPDAVKNLSRVIGSVKTVIFNSPELAKSADLTKVLSSYGVSFGPRFSGNLGDYSLNPDSSSGLKNPSDLIAPRGMTPIDAAQRAGVISGYRGETTSGDSGGGTTININGN
ncbi:hypothetical protein EON80_27535 [bacterium]|nr:MAG: hypothetical protein EON80_27535 [bacterium]